MVYSPTRRASRGPLSRLRRQLPLQGSLWVKAYLGAAGTIVPCRAVSRLTARRRSGSPALGTRREKCFRRPTSSTPTSPVQSRHIAAGEDGHHFGRARQSARPPSAGRISTQQPQRIVTGGAAALRPFLARVGARPITRKLRRQTEADTFRPPPKAFFLSGSLRDAFFCRHKRKRPSEKTKTPQVTLRRSCGYGSLEEENHFNVGCGLSRASVRK